MYMYVCAQARVVLTELEGASAGEKLLFRKRILEACKYIVGSSLSVPGNADNH